MYTREDSTRNQSGTTRQRRPYGLLTRPSQTGQQATNRLPLQEISVPAPDNLPHRDDTANAYDTDDGEEPPPLLQRQDLPRDDDSDTDGSEEPLEDGIQANPMGGNAGADASDTDGSEEPPPLERGYDSDEEGLNVQFQHLMDPSDNPADSYWDDLENEDQFF